MSKQQILFFDAGTPDGPPISELNEVVDAREAFYTLTKAKIGSHDLGRYIYHSAESET